MIVFREFIKLSGYMFSIGLSILMCFTFFWAYFYNNFYFTVYINMYGEAHLELALLICIIPIILYGMYYTAVDTLKNKG